MKKYKRYFYHVLFLTSSISAVRLLIGATSPLFLISRNLHVKDIVFLKSISSLIVLIADIPLGIISDKINRWITLFASSIFFTIWLFATAFAQTPISLYIAEVFFAFALAFESGSKEALVVESYRDNVSSKKEDAVKALAISNKTSFIAMSLTGLFGSFFISIKSNLNWIIAGSAMLLLSCYIAIYSFLKVKNLFTIRKTKLKILQGNINGLINYYRVFKGLFSNKRILQFFFISIIITYFYHIVIQYWQIILNFKENKTYYNLPIHSVLSIIFFVIFIAQAFNFTLIKWCKKSMAILLTVVFLQSSLFLISLKTHAPLVLIAIIVSYFWLFRGSYITLNAKIHSEVNDSIRATVFSLKAALIRTLIVILAPIASLLIKQSIYSGVSNLGIYCAATIILILITIYLFSRFTKSYLEKDDLLD